MTASTLNARKNLRSAGNAQNINDELWDSPLLRALRGEKNTRIPVWLMRQAGRYMQEYNEVKAKAKDFLDFCKRPELCSQVTLDAQRILNVDAAILFADLPPLLECCGLKLTYELGAGPLIHNPPRSAEELKNLRKDDPREAMPFVAETVKLVRAGLPKDIPLIGFSGAPFTLASYAIEAKGSKQYIHLKTLMYNEPEAFHGFMQHLTDLVIPYLHMQIEAGVQAVQIFDSWVGSLTRADYREFVAPYTKQVVNAMPEGIGVICFGAHTGHLIDLIAESGCDCVGIDTCTEISPAWQSLGGSEQVSVQGNLDPTLLLGPSDRLGAKIDTLLDETGHEPGFIFNLGHGIIKDSDPQLAIDLVKQIHSFTP